MQGSRGRALTCDNRPETRAAAGAGGLSVACRPVGFGRFGKHCWASSFPLSNSARCAEPSGWLTEGPVARQSGRVWVSGPAELVSIRCDGVHGSRSDEMAAARSDQIGQPCSGQAGPCSSLGMNAVFLLLTSAGGSQRAKTDAESFVSGPRRATRWG
jgi:hypothetical protein